MAWLVLGGVSEENLLNTSSFYNSIPLWFSKIRRGSPVLVGHKLVVT